jgi:hypothetical protein
MTQKNFPITGHLLVLFLSLLILIESSDLKPAVTTHAALVSFMLTLRAGIFPTHIKEEISSQELSGLIQAGKNVLSRETRHKTLAF